jgi:hypothetical protein
VAFQLLTLTKVTLTLSVTFIGTAFGGLLLAKEIGLSYVPDIISEPTVLVATLPSIWRPAPILNILAAILLICTVPKLVVKSEDMLTSGIMPTAAATAVTVFAEPAVFTILIIKPPKLSARVIAAPFRLSTTLVPVMLSTALPQVKLRAVAPPAPKVPQL